MPGIALAPVDIEIPVVRGLGQLRLPTGVVMEGSAIHIVNKLHQLFAFRLADEIPGAALIHGATFKGRLGRIVLIGEKGSGKTTLSLHMLAAGYEIEGDEHIAVFEQDALTRPRNLRIKEGSLSLIPGLRDQVLAAPALPHPDGGLVYSWAPQIAGRPWTIERGPISALVFIESNHGGHSVMQPLRVDQAFAHLMKNVAIADAGMLLCVARLRMLVARAASWRLSLGSPASAERHLSRLLAA